MWRGLLIFFCALSGLATEVVTPIVLLDSNSKPDERSILLDVSIVRFIPKNAAQIEAALKTRGKTIGEFIDALAKTGTADEMFRSARYLSGWPKETVSLQSIEHRPALRIGAPGEKSAYNTFGMKLKIAAAPSDDLTALNIAWDGAYSWSTNLIPRRIWEQVLTSVMAAGQAVGAGFTEEDHSESVGLRRGSGNAVGKDLVSLFKRKKVKAKEAAPALVEEAQPHYIDALRQERPILGQLALGPDQLAIIPVTGASDGSLELFFFAIRYEWSSSEK